jgi:hypothetical protein
VTTRALTFLANDRYLDWAKIFLESVRSKDADLPVYCIPYDDRIDGITALQRPFGFELLTDGLDRLVPFADRLFPHLPRHRANLRKYASLTLAVDEVAYFDIDMALLVEPARLFGHIAAGEADLVYFSTSPQWVYHPSQLARAQTLFPEMRLISAGAFLASRKTLTIDEVIGTVEQNLALYRSLRQSKVYDQPVLNFVLHKLQKRCRHIGELDPSLCGMASFLNPNLRWVNGRITDRTGPAEVLAIHWAGIGKSSFEILNPRIWGMRRLRQSLRRQAEQRIRAGARPAA